MVIIRAIAHRDTADLAHCLSNHQPHRPRTFIPDLIQGAQVKPCTGWPNLTKPPTNGWWADRQSCQCPPCYFYSLTDQINSGALPFSVAVPLAQLINVGLIRLNFRHADHNDVFTTEDRDYALSLHRDICYGINSGQLPLQLLEILLVASRKAVLKPSDAREPEYQHKEFELYLKRAIRKCKEDQSNGQNEEDNDEQAQEGAHQEDDHDDDDDDDDDDDSDLSLSSSDEVEDDGAHDGRSDTETAFLWTASAAIRSRP